MAQGQYCAFYNMYTKRHTNYKQITIDEEFDTFEGESIEEKVRRVESTNSPIEQISPMLYTERKDGILPETNIRTDKWDIAMEAMQQIADGKRKIREERMKKSAGEPDAGSKVDVQQ